MRKTANSEAVSVVKGRPVDTYTPSELSKRGWTKALIPTLLGNPDYWQYPNGFVVYLKTRVKAAEKDPRFKARPRKTKRAV